MRPLTLILFYSFFLITFIPGTVMIVNSIKAECAMNCKEADDACDMNDMACCTRGVCNPVQCCFCCFVCPVDNKQIEIRIFETGIKKSMTEDGNLFSGHTSDCWQPPKKV